MAEPGMSLSGVSGQPVMGQDPDGKAQHLQVDADKKLIVSAAVTATTAAKSTAAAPSNVEGSTNPLSGDLNGNLRTIGKLLGDDGATLVGTKADAADTHTDTTAITWTSIFKQISKSVQLMVFGAGTAAAAQRTTLASDDPAVATLGATTGAAVITDANGTIQQYLRGLVKLIAGTLTVSISSAAGTRIEGTIAAGATAQAVFGQTPANGFEIINTHASENLYIRESASAATVADNSFNTAIVPGGSYMSPPGYKPGADVSIIATTTSHAYIARRW